MRRSSPCNLSVGAEAHAFRASPSSALLCFQTQMLLGLCFHERFEKLCCRQLERRHRRILETGLQNLSYLLSTQSIGEFVPSSGKAQGPADPLEIASHRDDVPEVLILLQALDE